MKNKENIFWGILLIVVGIIFLGNNIAWWNVDIFFDGWWTLFIIIPSIRGLFYRGGYACSIVTLVIGVLMLLACRNIINWSMILKIVIPLIIIVVGLSLIINNKKSNKNSAKNAKEYIAVFSGVDEKIKGTVSDFRTVAVFGGIELDLSNALIKKDIVINAIAIFGGIDLKLPDNVKVEINGVPVFGGIENKMAKTGEEIVTIHVNYVCVFGGIDIL